MRVLILHSPEARLRLHAVDRLRSTIDREPPRSLYAFRRFSIRKDTHGKEARREIWLVYTPTLTERQGFNATVYFEP